MKQTPTATKTPVNIVGSSSFGRYSKISSEQTWNMFISDDWLVNWAGWKRVYDLLPTGTGRGLFRSIRGNIMIAVVNANVYSIDVNLGITLIGALNTVTGEVFMDENINNQICIVDGLNAYIYNYANPPLLVVQTLASGLIPNYVSYNDTFFNFGNASTTNAGAFWYTYQYDTPTTISLVSNQAIQTKPDYALAVVRLPGQSSNVFVMGKAVSEVWTHVGGSENYRKNTTVSCDYGCASVSTIACSENYVCWLAINENNSPVIATFDKTNTINTISTDGIDYALSEIQFPAQSKGMFYRQDGHLFYQLTFFNPVDNKTFAYDFNTQKFFQLSDSQLNYHPAQDFVEFNNHTYFLSINNGSLYESSSNFTVNDENTAGVFNPMDLHEIQRIRVCAPLRDDEASNFTVNLLSMTIEQGCDPEVTQLALDNYDIYMITEDVFNPPDAPIVTEWGIPIVDERSWMGAPIRNNPPYQPRVDLSLSRDGGITWGTTVGRELHPIGWRQNMLSWNKLGLTNDLTCKFRFWGRYRYVVGACTAQLYR